MPSEPAALSADDTDHGLQRVAVTVISVGTVIGGPKAATLRSRGWQEGPLPLVLPTGRGQGTTADRKARRQYLDDHCADTVLGAPQPSGPDAGWRLHQHLGSSVETEDGAVIWGVELVRLRELGLIGEEVRSAASRGESLLYSEDLTRPAHALVLHATVDPSGRTLPRIIAAIRSVRPAELPASTGVSGLEVASSKHRLERFRLVMATRDVADVPILPGPVAQERRRHWAFALASATLPAALGSLERTDFECDDETLLTELSEQTFLAPSADWRAAVLRDGAAFVGLRPDAASSSESGWVDGMVASEQRDFFDVAELYVRTVYADILLLAMLQRRALITLRSVLLAVGAAESDSVSRARALERELALFRERFWWTDATRGGVGDRLLSAYHHQHRMQQLYDAVSADVASIAERVERVSGRGRDGALVMIGFVSIFSVMLGVGRALFPSGQIGVVVGAVTVSVFVVTLLICFFRGIRRAVLDGLDRSWLHDRPPHRRSSHP